jgi:hypothetical protein
MAALADDWEENRQTCVDVLCAYLGLPGLEPGTSSLSGSSRASDLHRLVRELL